METITLTREEAVQISRALHKCHGALDACAVQLPNTTLSELAAEAGMLGVLVDTKVYA